MLLRFERDQGASLSFLVIPDDGSSIPSAIVKNDGVELLQFQSNRTDPGLVKQKLHVTGQCGFVLTNKQLPDLASLDALEICEASTGVMLYRRPRPDFRKMRLFRLETHLLPLWRFDDALKASFQFWFKGIDRYGLQTTQQTFVLINTESVYSSGRLYMKFVERFLTRGWKAVTVIRDPYEELAERIIILKNAGARANDLLGPRDSITFEHVIAELAELEKFDEATIKRFFKRASSEVLDMLSNPLVRLLTAANPGDRPPHSGVGIALQMLSEFAVLGLRSAPEEFSAGVADLIDRPLDAVPVVHEYPKVTEVGAILRNIRDVEHMLEQDLEIFHHTKAAFGSVAAKAT